MYCLFFPSNVSIPTTLYMLDFSFLNNTYIVSNIVDIVTLLLALMLLLYSTFSQVPRDVPVCGTLRGFTCVTTDTYGYGYAWGLSKEVGNAAALISY